MSNSDDRFDVSIIPPAAGPAPMPPPELREVFATLKDIQTGPPAMEDDLRTVVDTALLLVRALLLFPRVSPRAHGLSAHEIVRWARAIPEPLSGPQRAQLLEYVQTCRGWERALREAIDWGEADWEVRDARYVDPSSAEAALARGLTGFGIPVQSHAGVAEDAVRRRWGDRYTAFSLRWAHRDRAHLLRLAIDLDGQYLHLHGAKQEYDQERNEILADRGWYVVQLSGQEYQWLALEPLAALVEQHRRAIVLARSDLPALKRNFA